MLSLTTPLASKVTKGDPVVDGLDTSGRKVVGKAYADASAGTSTLKVQYSTSEVQDSYSDCQVGGLQDTTTTGCYSATGSVSVGGQSYTYEYNVDSDNDNGRTLAGFSTGADTSMRVNTTDASIMPMLLSPLPLVDLLYL